MKKGLSVFESKPKNLLLYEFLKAVKRATETQLGLTLNIEGEKYMKKTVLLSLMLIIPVIAMAEEKPMTEDQKTLYFLGYNVLSRNLKPFEFTPEESKYILSGLTDALNSVPGKVDESYGPKINELVGKKQAAVAQKEKAKGQAFLEKMAKEKNAQKLPSGVIFIPMKEGKGASPKGHRYGESPLSRHIPGRKSV